MDYQHFGLSAQPFSPMASPEGLFLGNAHREGLAALQWGLCEPSGFTLLVGEIGTGKTTLIRALLAGRPAGVRAAWVANPRLSFEEILEVLATQLELHPARFRRLDFLQALDALVVSLRREECVVLVFDEAQSLSDEILEDLRLLSNFQSAQRGRLQIILVGQLELMQRLARPELRQLDQRIGARCLLAPLKAGEVWRYVDHQLQRCGGDVRRLFTRSARKALNRYSGGIPRKINVLCHDALMCAYSKGSKKVRGAHLGAAARGYGDLVHAAQRHAQLPGAFKRTLQSNRLRLSAAVVSALALGLFALSAADLSHLPDFGAFGSLGPARSESKARLLTGGKGVPPGPQPLDDRAEKTKEVSLDPAFADPTTVTIAGGEAQGSESAGPVAKPVVHSSAQQDARRATKPPPALEVHNSPRILLSRASEPKLEVSTVMVNKGDTLSKIAARWLGSTKPEQIRSLLKANPGIVNANLIYPGQTLYFDRSEDGALSRVMP